MRSSGEFAAGYIDAYRARLTEMLGIGEELSLVRLPDVTISGIPSVHPYHAEFCGRPVQELDAATLEGVTARGEAEIGVAMLGHLDSLAAMQLFFSTFVAEVPSEDMGPSLTARQEVLVDEILASSRRLTESGYHTYNKYGFVDSESSEHIAVTSSRIVNEAQAPIARELRVVVRDESLARTLLINELPTSFDGKAELSIRQSLSPVDNQALREAQSLFREIGLEGSMDLLLKLFMSESRGIKNPAAEALLARYNETKYAERMRGVMDAIKREAAGARANRHMILANPEMALPSATELADYHNVLSRIRA